MIGSYFYALFFDFQSFTCWFWLLYPVVILFLGYLIKYRSVAGFTAFMLPKEIYRSSSFYDDIKINVAYLVYGFFTLGLGFSLQSAIALAVGKTAYGIIDTWIHPSASDPWPLFAITLFFALTSDFANFLNHFLMHKIPWLWSFHKVHHAAEHLTPLTQFRSHPVEPLSRDVVTGIVVGLAGTLLVLIGALDLNHPPATSYLVVYLIYYMTIHFRHSHHWVSFGPLSYIFNSPSMHQIHHSIELRHRGKNYGIVFSFWDQLFGSFYYPKVKETFRIGLESLEEQERYRGLWRSLIEPFSLIKGSIWVFGPVADLVAFLMPPLVALALVPLTPATVHQGEVASGLLLYNLFVAMMIDHGHVYGTVVPVYLDRWRRRRLSWRAIFLPLLALICGVGLAALSTQLFSTCLAYLAIWHICRQHYGWMVALERKERAASLTKFQTLDRLFFLGTILVPLYYWQADLSYVPRRYFSDYDLAVVLSPSAWPTAFALYAVLTAVFVMSVFYRLAFEGSERLGKFFFLFLTWVWFFGGLVLAKNAIFFWITLTICHGVSYHIHINRYWRSSFGGDPPTWFRAYNWRTIGGYLVAVTALAIFLFSTRGIWAGGGEGWRLAVINFFLISHYLFDAFIWRKGFRAEPALA